jgi:predicted ATPase with chaperone activity
VLIIHRTQSVKLARTIVDLAACEEIQSVHLTEALQYHPRLMIG